MQDEAIVPILSLSKFLPQSSQGLAEKLQQSYSNHPGFRHPFWDWFAEGKFSLPTLKDFALMYYGHVKVFRQYLAGALTLVEDERLQIALSEIIADEYGIPPLDEEGKPRLSHPELFRRFMLSLGIRETEWNIVQVIPGIEYFKSVHYSLFRSGLLLESLGAVIFGCEGSTPYRHSRVVSGMIKFCKRENASIDYSFFSAHVGLDIHHFSLLLDPIRDVLADESQLQRFIHGIQVSFDARKVFLDDISIRLGLPLASHQ